MLPPPWLVAGALLLVGVGVAWTTAALVHEERALGVRQSDAWSEEGRFSYVVPVEGEDAPRPMGEPGYFTTRSPRVPIEFIWRADDPRGAPLEGSAALALRIVATATGKEAWRVDAPLDAEPIAERRASLAGTLDFAEAESLVERARLENGKRNETLTWSLVAHVTYARDGADSTSEFTLPLRYDAPLFVLPGADESVSTRSHATTEPYEQVSRAGLRGLQDDPRGPAALAAGLAVLFLAARRARPHPGASA